MHVEHEDTVYNHLQLIADHNEWPKYVRDNSSLTFRTRTTIDRNYCEVTKFVICLSILETEETLQF